MIKLLKQMRKQEWLMAGLCALLVLGQIYFDLRLPDYMSDLTVLIKTPGSTVSDIWKTGAEMLGCTLASALLAITCGYLSSQIAAGFSYTVRERVFNQVADFGQRQMQQFSVPSLINRTTNDITQIQMLVAMGLQILIKSPIMAVWAVIKIINKSWTLSAITAGFVVALLSMMAVVIVVILPRVRRVQKLTDNINRVSRENLTGINVVHAYNAEDYQAEKFEAANDTLMKTQLFNQRAMALLMPAVSFAMNALALVIYWVGASIVNTVAVTDMAARISAFGDVVVFGTYATYVIMSIMMMVMVIMLLPSAQVSAGRIHEVLEAEIDLQEGTQTEASEQGTVEFKDVSFHYPTSDKDVLEHISFKVNKGETIAFIGATGSGKTTLISLAARFYDATSGQVLIDGRDVKDYTFDALYDRIGYVTQKAVLFAGNIKENILFGESGAEQTDENIRNVPRTGNRRVLHGEHELAVHADVALGKVGASHLTDQEQRGVVLLRQLLLGQPKDIVVVRAGQTLVARDHDIACPAVFPLGALIEVNMLDLGRMVQDIRDRGADLHKIRLHAVQLLPRPAQLGGRDQIHRVRDLERLLHAVNTGSDLLYACHTALTCSL